MNRLMHSICAGLLLTVFSLAAVAGNNSWTLTGPPSGQVQSLAVHPTNANIALASGNRGIHRSTDGGATWTKIASDTLFSPQQILFDPSSPNRVVAMDSSLYLSVDTGLTFVSLPTPDPVYQVARAAFGGDGALYAAAFAGRLYRSVPPYASWTEIPHGWNLLTSHARELVVDPADPNRIYAAVDGAGIFRTDNANAGGMMSWTGPLTNGLSIGGNNFNRLVVSPTRPTDVFLATRAGVFRSTDRGVNWVQVDATSATDIAIDPSNADVVIAIRENAQQSRSINGGAIFSAFGPNFRLRYEPQLRFVPGSPNHILYATERGVGSSVDGGATMAYGASGILGGILTRVVMANDGRVFVTQPSGFNDIFLRQDPAVASTYLAVDGAAGTAALTTGPRLMYSLAVAPTESNILFAVNGVNQLLRTYDRGSSFSQPHAALTAGSSTDQITDVQFAPDTAMVAYVARSETGVWKTTDAGLTFNRLMLSPTFVGSIAIHPANTAVIYASGGASHTDIYKSIDSGLTWSQQSTPALTNLFFNGFSFDPVDEGTVYGLTSNGVLKTVDGGAHWDWMNFSQFTGIEPSAVALLIDPVVPTTMTLVNATKQPGFLRTVDAGNTWMETPVNLPGRNFTLNRAVMLSPGHLVAGSGTGVVEYTVAPDLSLTMSATPATLPLSTTQSFTFTITNNGDHDSSASELVLGRPSWLTPVVPSNCTLTVVLTCRIGVLRAHTSTQLTVSYAVGATTIGSLFTAVLTGHEPDSDTSNNRVERSMISGEVIDLDLTFAATPSTIDNGQMTEFVATLVNNGPSPATNVTLNTTGVINFIYQSVFPSRGSCTIGAFPTCSFGTVPAGGTVTVRMGLIGQTPGDFQITGQVAATGPDSDGQQNTATQTIRVRPVGDVSVFLAESADPVVVDGALQYVATVRRLAGDGGQSQLLIVVAGASVRSTATTEGSCTNTGSVVDCSMNPASSATVTLTLDTPTPGIATASATLNYPGTDTVPGNNTATIGTTIRRTADFSVALAGSVAATALNTDYTYTATVRNNGPNAAPAQLIIPLMNAVVMGVTGNGGQCTTTTSSVNCSHTQVASGATWEIAVRAQTPTPSTSQASATLTTSAFDPDSANNLASAQVTATRIADLGVTMTESVDPALTGTAFSYTANVSNLGPNAGDVRLTVPVTGATVTAATPTTGTCTVTASQATCDFPAFTGSSTASVRIDVNASAVGTAQAVATLTFNGTDPVATNNSVTVSTTVIAPPGTPPNSGGGGGGGRFDWLAISALAVLSAFKWRRRIPARAI